MDQHYFDGLSRTLARLPSRRDVLRGLAGAGLGLGALRQPDAIAAKKKGRHKKTRKKHPPSPPLQPSLQLPLVFNQYGCVEVGQACRGDNSLCCSGICDGAVPANEHEPDNSRCAAHGSGTCHQDREGICTIPNLALATCNNRSNCGCIRTVAGSNFCAELFSGGPGSSQCAFCQRDADCVALGLPPETACAPVFDGICAGLCPTGMACLVPCAALPPS